MATSEPAIDPAVLAAHMRQQLEAHPPVFARVDTPADEARTWLTRQWAAQAERDDAPALHPEVLADLGELLTASWWEQVFEQDDTDTAASDRLRRALPPAVRAAAALPSGGTVLALYLRHLVNEAWELSWDHTLLTLAVDTACTAAAEVTTDGTARAAWELLDFLRSEFRTETALLTGRVDAAAAAAAATADHAARIVADLSRLPSGAARDAVREEAVREALYYRTVAGCARTIRALVAGEKRTINLDASRRRVDAAGFGPRDLSELRAHFAAVAAVYDARDRDRLRIDRGRVRMVYPFGIRTGPDHDEISIVAALRDAVAERRSAGGELGGLAVKDIRGRLDLADVWQGTDTFGRGYRGATFELAPLTFAGASPDTPAEVIVPTVQLSELGNHALVFDIDLSAAEAHRVAETISLASPVYGDLHEIPDLVQLRTASGELLAGLPAVVSAMWDSLRALLEHIRIGDAGEAQLAARAGSFGVIVTVLAASRITGSGSVVPLTTAAELTDLWGVQSLVHPLPSGAAGIVDWAMYDLDRVSTWPLLHLNRELLAANSNVTLLASFSSPAYAVHEIGSFATFAHSLHGLYQGWQDTVREHAEMIAGLLRSAERLLARSDTLDRTGAHSISARRGIVIEELERLVRRVERAELSLQTFVQSNEAIMLFIESPGLVASPPLRVDLDTVLSSNGYERLRTGYTQAVRDVVGTPLRPLLDVVHGRMQQTYAAHSAALDAERERRAHRAAAAQEERDRRFARVIEILGVVFAVIGLSGLVSILQDGHPDWDGTVSWVLVTAVLVAAGACGGLLLVTTRTRRRDRTTERETS